MVYRLATIIHSHLSHGQNIFLHFQDPPEVSSHCGSRLRLKVKDLSSKSGLGTKGVPRNQFLGCSSMSVILSDLPDAHPRHHRPFKRLSQHGKRGGTQIHGSSGFQPGLHCQVLFCLSLWLLLLLSGLLVLLFQSFSHNKEPAFAVG